MNKTLHQQLTKKSYRTHAATLESTLNESILTDLAQEMKGYLKEAANDLLQPRPEAVARILQKATVRS